MEKRFYLGAALLAVILILGIVTMNWLERDNETIVQTLEKALESAQAGDFPRATQLAKQAQGRWRGGWKGFACVADHRQLDEIDALFSQTLVAGEGAFSACCARLTELVRSVVDDHSLTWWNLL